MKNKKSMMITTYLKMIPKPELFMAVLAFGLICFVVFPESALAWDAKAAVLNLLDFFKMVFLLVACIAAGYLFAKSQIVGAVITVVVAALLYVILTPEIMQSIGEGFTKLLTL